MPEPLRLNFTASFVLPRSKIGELPTTLERKIESSGNTQETLFPLNSQEGGSLPTSSTLPEKPERVTNLLPSNIHAKENDQTTGLNGKNQSNSSANENNQAASTNECNETTTPNVATTKSRSDVFLTHEGKANRETWLKKIGMNAEQIKEIDAKLASISEENITVNNEINDFYRTVSIIEGISGTKDDSELKKIVKEFSELLKTVKTEKLHKLFINSGNGTKYGKFEAIKEQVSAYRQSKRITNEEINAEYLKHIKSLLDCDYDSLSKNVRTMIETLMQQPASLDPYKLCTHRQGVAAMLLNFGASSQKADPKEMPEKHSVSPDSSLRVPEPQSNEQELAGPFGPFGPFSVQFTVEAQLPTSEEEVERPNLPPSRKKETADAKNQTELLVEERANEIKEPRNGHKQAVPDPRIHEEAQPSEPKEQNKEAPPEARTGIGGWQKNDKGKWVQLNAPKKVVLSPGSSGWGMGPNVPRVQPQVGNRF